jgi:hypothetical protein
MKLNINKSWLEEKIKLEGDSEIGAGNPNFNEGNWETCCHMLAEKLKRFQNKGYLSGHDSSLSFYEQLCAKKYIKKL